MSKDDDDEDNEPSMNDLGDGEVFEYFDEDDLEQLKNEAAHFCPVLLGEMDDLSDNVYDLRQLIRQYQKALILSAKIGQTLVTRTDKLSRRSKILECELDVKTDQVRQLEHEKKKLNEDLRSELYGGDEDRNSPSHSTNLLSSCCNCDKYQSQYLAVNDQLERLKEENLKKTCEIARLSALLGNERASANKAHADSCRRLDLAEAEVRRLKDQKRLNKRKIEELKVDLKCASNDIHNLASFLAKAEIELQAQCDGFAKEKSTFQTRLDETTSLCDEYMVLYNELKTENAILLKSQCKNQLHCRCSSRQGELSVADELSSSLPRERPKKNRKSEETSCSGQLMKYWCGIAEADLMPPRLFYVGNSMRFQSILGQPGRPGSHELDASLLRLSINSSHGHVLVSYPTSYNRAWSWARRKAIPSEILWSGHNIKSIKSSEVGDRDDEMSNKRSIDKFQNGSCVLRSWRQLSTPHLGTLLELNEGVLVRYSVDVRVSKFESHRTPSSFHQSFDLGELDGGGISTYEDFSSISGSISDIEEDSV